MEKNFSFFLCLFRVVNYSFVVQFFSHHYYILCPQFLDSSIPILFHSEIIFEDNNNNNLLRTLIIGDPNNNNNNKNNNNNYPLCVLNSERIAESPSEGKAKKIQFRFTKNMMILILTIEAMIPIYSLDSWYRI